MVHLRYFKRAVKMEFNSLILTERGKKEREELLVLTRSERSPLSVPFRFNDSYSLDRIF